MSTEVNPDTTVPQPAEAIGAETILAPSGMDLRPEPENAVRISKRVGVILCGLGLVICGILAYSGISRQKQRTAAALNGPHKKVEPALPDDMQPGLTLTIPPASRPAPNSVAVPLTSESAQLQTPPNQQPNERVIVRSAPVVKAVPAAPAAPPIREATPEERALASAYATEQQARLAPTGIRNITGAGLADRNQISAGSSDSAPTLEALVRTLNGNSSRGGSPASQSGTASRTEYEEQNLQAQKEGFLDKAQLGNVREDYLKFTRTAPMSRFEIKAGWEIPAVLEQALNSDLPGELKALVMSNVYDTASGLYLLIPQGSRLVGTYNSRISYGQNGIQVAWNRIIFPDASAIDLSGMNGLDAQGNSGLRDKVDRHYKQLFGFAVLTSLFDAALAITQNRQQSVLVYPSATQDAESAVGREVSQLGTQITRKNLNVQPTVKIPAGYKFNVRVNKDILFEEPYGPVQPSEFGTAIRGEVSHSKR